MKTWITTLSLIITCHLYGTKVAVFCSADDKACTSFKILAYSLGEKLAFYGHGLITGGSNTGLMKEVVDGYRAQGGLPDMVNGILPIALRPYHVQHPAIPHENLIWVNTMHERLSTFHALVDSIIVLPGGFGTLHELMDFLVHNQFSDDKKCIILLNYSGYWDSLITLFSIMRHEKLLSDKHASMLTIASTLEDCMSTLSAAAHATSPIGLVDRYWENELL